MTPYGKRLLVASIGIPLVLACAYWGGWPLAALVAVAGCLGAREGFRLLAAGAPTSPLWVAYLLAVALPALAVQDWPVGFAAALVLTAVLAALVVLHYPPESGRAVVVAVLFLLVYPLTCLQHVLWLRLEFGWPMMFYLLALVWAGDTAAYEGGRRMGKRPLAPRLSPKKTLEGALWSLFATLCVAVMAWWLWPHGRSLMWFAISAPLVWLLATVGDLFESLLKRSAAVKDSSRLLSEHGGVLDRFDSLLFASVGLYYFSMWCA